MQKVLDINQIKAIISKHLNKKIVDNLLKPYLYHKFYYNNGDILYAKTDVRYIFFCDFLNDMNMDRCHYLYEYLPNKYFIINIYLTYNNDISISINGKELDVDEFEFSFNDLNSNIINYINSIKLLYKL